MRERFRRFAAALPFIHPTLVDPSELRPYADPETRKIMLECLSAAQAFRLDVFSVGSELGSAILGMAVPVYRLESLRGKDESGFSYLDRPTYSEYEFENYLLRANLLWDRTLQLANVLLRLGLAAEAVDWERIQERVGGSDYEVLESLRSFRRAMGGIRRARNAAVHISRLTLEHWSDPPVPCYVGAKTIDPHDKEGLMRWNDSALDDTLRLIDSHNERIGTAFAVVCRILHRRLDQALRDPEITL